METQSIALSCDDYYLSLIAAAAGDEYFTDGDESDDALMSDSKYAQHLQFQDVIISSISTNSSLPNNPKITTTPKKEEEIEIGEPSQHTCEICAEKKDNNQMFAVRNCTHRYCTECITKHVSIKLQKSKTLDNTCFFTCPDVDCEGGVLDLDSCRKIMPDDVVGMWEDAICESLIVASQRYYCPFKDCSGMIVNDNEEGVVIRESECPFCHRLFCAQCGVAWHSGFECEEFSKLNASERGRDDLLVYELAKKEKWQRCPRCKFFVEKTEGCLHMTCRCGYHFCYACGETYTSNHGGCRPR